VAPGYCYTDRHRETGFSSFLLFTEAGEKQTARGMYGKSTYLYYIHTTILYIFYLKHETFMFYTF